MNEALKYAVNIDAANSTKKEMAASLKTDNNRVLKLTTRKGVCALP